MTIGLNSDAGRRLLTIIERIERLREDKKAIAADEKEVFAEAKGNGYDPKTIRAVIKIRATDRARFQEAQALLELYLHAIGDESAPLFPGGLPAAGELRAQVGEALRELVPEGGSVTIEVAGGKAVRLSNRNGEVTVDEPAEA